MMWQKKPELCGLQKLLFLPQQTSSDFPEIACKGFKLNLDELLHDFLKTHVFGRVEAYDNMPSNFRNVVPLFLPSVNQRLVKWLN